MTIKENSNLIYIYDTTKQSTTQLEIKNLKNKFFWNSRVCQVGHKLYITGGHDDSSNGVKNCYFFDYFQNLENFEISEIKNMLYPHWGHLTIYHPENYIFVISGSYTKKCEFYNLNKKMWYSLPDISTWRMDPIGFVYNNQYLYIFSGWNNNNNIINKDPFVEKIERLKLFTKNSKWETLPISLKNMLKNNYLNFLKKTCMGILKLTENKILLLGGDTSDYLFTTKQSSSLASIDYNVNVKYHTSIIEVKINYLGNCEIEISQLNLSKPSCFTLNKEFICVGSKDNFNREVYGCFNHLHEFITLEI
jgi:hypothetical protein